MNYNLQRSDLPWQVESRDCKNDNSTLHRRLGIYVFISALTHAVLEFGVHLEPPGMSPYRLHFMGLPLPRLELLELLSHVSSVVLLLKHTRDMHAYTELPETSSDCLEI